MTDRELLEAAAEGAGYTVKGEAVDYSDQFTHLIVNSGHRTHKFRWNPLTDDGDALRLAVKLGLSLQLPHANSAFTGVGEAPNQFLERARLDPYAATRRAIVRAAAAIGGAQ